MFMIRRGTLGETTLHNANAISRHRLKGNPIKVDSQICEINAKRDFIKTITRLRTKHFRGVKIHKDGTRTYCKCNNCPVIPLPHHILNVLKFYVLWVSLEDSLPLIMIVSIRTTT
ncbi:hypothetical protein TNIN_109741 [Trichonephila inaurata madagascariensis]|uniref:Uncharacterized protein n=1 Tax=Trichonephila inaurata madagascariensis TaxID=2747483 RepID=A0A8X6J099_9ARAC|nr:hypothetical protein TNIN_109741 [Trichonephila inaurata madagascariensis]